MKKQIVAGMASLMAVASWGDALGAAADTHIRYGANQDNNYGAAENLDTRQNDTAPRDCMTYIRFDLSSYRFPITEATFSLTQSGGDSLVNGRIRVLGLNNVAGNTAQNWDESALTFNTAGSEINTAIYPSPEAGATALDSVGGLVTDFEEGVAGITESTSGGVLTLSGPAFAAWLETRRLDGGLATLIVDFPAGASDKSVYYASKEHAALVGPMLEVIHEPGTLGLVALAKVEVGYAHFE